LLTIVASRSEGEESFPSSTPYSHPIRGLIAHSIVVVYTLPADTVLVCGPYLVIISIHVIALSP